MISHVQDVKLFSFPLDLFFPHVLITLSVDAYGPSAVLFSWFLSSLL